MIDENFLQDCLRWSIGGLRRRETGVLVDTIKSQQARIERLEFWLKDIASHPCHPDCNHQDVARVALSPTPPAGEGK